VIVELRWAVVTGIVDHRSAQQSLSVGGKFGLPSAEQIYRRVELERQIQQRAGVWSSWQPVDPEPTLQILDNMPEEDAERTPDELRIGSLVDPLPYRKGEIWNDVDVERFIPKLRVDEANRTLGGLGRQIQQPPRPKPAGGMMGGGMMPGRQIQQPPRPEPAVLMLRRFDFTVEPGQTYRYRVQVVIDDARRRTDVAGAWSEPTNPVTAR
jgi:hypothetical protein